MWSEILVMQSANSERTTKRLVAFVALTFCTEQHIEQQGCTTSSNDI